MDFVTLLALVLFVGMIVSWFVLPSASSTGVEEQSAEAPGLLGAKQQA